MQVEQDTFNVGIYLAISSFQMEHLVDMCCDDIKLVMDILDTFCVQGRERLDSLEISAKKGNLPNAVNDAVRDLAHLLRSLK